MKTKIHHITNVMYALLAAILVVAVFLSATHAKDIVNNQPTRAKSKSARVVETIPTRTVLDEPIQKSINDLHNHTDKTMLKNFVKAVGDAPSLAAKRQEREDHLDGEEQPVSLRLFQAYFMMQIAYASVRA